VFVPEHQWVEASGQGTIYYSYVIAHEALCGWTGKVPYVVAIIEIGRRTAHDQQHRRNTGRSRKDRHAGHRLLRAGGRRYLPAEIPAGTGAVNEHQAVISTYLKSPLLRHEHEPAHCRLVLGSRAHALEHPQRKLSGFPVPVSACRTTSPPPANRLCIDPNKFHLTVRWR
jgi:hypothetical protein